MKRLSILALVLAGCFAGSCSDDDNNDDNNSANLAGSYNMTAYNAPMAIDYDDDGDSSTNLMTESTCFNNSTMTLNSNGTYSMHYNGVTISNGLSSCASTSNTTGTWTRNGNTITATPTGGGTATSWSWSSSNKTLTNNATNAQYPSFNSTTGMYIYATGNTSTVYTMQ